MGQTTRLDLRNKDILSMQACNLQSCNDLGLVAISIETPKKDFQDVQPCHLQRARAAEVEQVSLERNAAQVAHTKDTKDIKMSLKTKQSEKMSLKTLKTLKTPVWSIDKGHPNNKAMRKTLPNFHATYVRFQISKGGGGGGFWHG